jgi:hypothetical protein
LNYDNFAINLACAERQDGSDPEACIQVVTGHDVSSGASILPRSSACLSTIASSSNSTLLPHMAVLAGGKLNCGIRLSDETWLYNHHYRRLEPILAPGMLTTARLTSSRDNSNPGLNAAACSYFPPSSTFVVFGGEESTGYSTRLQTIRLSCSAGYEEIVSGDFSQGCQSCRLGTFSSSTLEDCRTCPLGFSTSNQGSDSISNCTVCARCVLRARCACIDLCLA